MNPDIRTILNAARSAPSVQNCQPWQWVVRAHVLTLYKTSNCDCVTVDYAVTEAQYVAFGGAVELACIAASQRGYRADVTYFPDQEDTNCIAEITLHKDPSIVHDPLALHIPERVTNRKPYTTEPLTNAQKSILEKVAGGSLSFIEDPTALKKIAYAAAAHDALPTINDRAHFFLFSHINWNEAQDKRRRFGHNLASLELGRNAPLFSLMRSQRFVRVISLFGFTSYVRWQMARSYRASAAYGVIRSHSTEPIDYIVCGRRVMRVWLTATKLGLSIQPLLGTLYGALSVRRENSMDYSPRAASLLTHAEHNIYDACGSREDTIMFLFRIGHASPPSGRSERFSLDTVVHIDSPE